MGSVIEELDANLQAMLLLKSGVSGSKIAAILSLCENNIQNESVIVQKIYTHFKKAPPSYKLGVLYVVDAVSRKWLELAKRGGQSLETAPDGTYGAGFRRISEILPVLMNDIIQHAPNDQKEKVNKLITIWKRGNTFPDDILTSFEQKLAAPTGIASNLLPANTVNAPATIDSKVSTAANEPNNTSLILQQLQNIAALQKPAQPQASGQLAQGSTSHVPAPPPSANPLPAPMNGGQFLPVGNVNMAANGSLAFPNAFNLPGSVASSAAAPQGQIQMPPAQALQASGPTDTLQQQIQVIQYLASQGASQDQIAVVLGAMLQNGGAAANADSGQPAWQSQPATFGSNANNSSWNQNTQGRDHDIRSPPQRRRGNARSRSRSRSPDSWRPNDRAGNSSPQRRRSPVYDDYDAQERNNGQDNGGDRRRRQRGGRNRYRDRSPMGNRREQRSITPDNRDDSAGPGGEKWTSLDPSIGKDRIKVFSRTLFVGGVTCGDRELRRLFSEYGQVQTCIVNTDKRHGFVKMKTREMAVRARTGMETYNAGDLQLRTRWGVGFGPRDCSDYATGVSIIPITRLTEADKKWMLSAPFGGTGGAPIVSGLVVEEPDIEIGAGVSSKAISRRMVTDQSGTQGPRSSDGGGRGRYPGKGGGGFGGQFDGPPAGSANAVELPKNNSQASQPTNPFLGGAMPQLPANLPLHLFQNAGITFPGMPQPPPS